MIHVKNIQQQDIRPQGADQFRVGHIIEQRGKAADGLAGQRPPLSRADGKQQIVLAHLSKIRGIAV